VIVAQLIGEAKKKIIIDTTDDPISEKLSFYDA
jgi:hypothetical protein